MRGDASETSHVWMVWTVLLFTMTLVMVVHSSTAMIFIDRRRDNGTHPLLDTTNMPALILHSLAYYLACFATTVFLLICAAIILGLATMAMELAVELYYLARHLLERSRRERTRPQADSDEEVLDMYCDSWNYR